MSRFILIVLLSALPLGIFAPDPCRWLEKTPLADPLPSCSAACFAPCTAHPGEMVCTGKRVYTDDDLERYDMASTDK